MRSQLELVCKALGVLCLCGGLLLGVDVLSTLWQWPLPASYPDFSSVAEPAVREALKPLHEALHPSLGTRVRAFLPPFMARCILPMLLGLFLMRSRLLVDFCYPPAPTTEPHGSAAPAPVAVTPAPASARGARAQESDESDARFAPPGYRK